MASTTKPAQRSSINGFKASPLGRRIGELFESAAFVDEMVALSEDGVPAAQRLGKPIMAFGLPVSDDDKRNVGKWVREVMETRGWTVRLKAGSRKPRSRSVAAGNLFTRGALYFPKG